MSDETIVVEPIIQNITVVDGTARITVASPGPQGNPATVFYTHTQGTPSAVWTIDHNLGGNPTAVVIDSAGTQCEGTFSYPTLNQMVITFTAAFSGVAYVI
jgi:hypothetical protein